MRIHHVAVFVRDLETAREYYEKYFGASANGLYNNPKTGLKTYFLAFEGGGRLEIMSKPNTAETENSLERIGYSHVSFGVGGKDSVDRITETLREDGYAVFSEPRVTGDGYYESCVSDPDGNRVEIVAA